MRMEVDVSSYVISSHIIGGVLSIECKDRRLVAYFSESLNKTE